jgi:hypothetical protein
VWSTIIQPGTQRFKTSPASGETFESRVTVSISCLEAAMLNVSVLAFVVLPVVTAIGCDYPEVSLPTPPPEADFSARGSNGIVLSSSGGGHYLFQNTFDVQFAYTAKQHANGRVQGEFHQSFMAEGELIAFRGDVICMALDPVHHRAWIGAVITENTSTHPQFQEWYHQPGEDVWFRVVDYGEGSDDPPDRTTFMGFENTPMIPSSEIYCQMQIWPQDDARTWPVTAGNIKVRPSEEEEDDN